MSHFDANIVAIPPYMRFSVDERYIISRTLGRTLAMKLFCIYWGPDDFDNNHHHHHLGVKTMLILFQIPKQSPISINDSKFGLSQDPTPLFIRISRREVSTSIYARDHM